MTPADSLSETLAPRASQATSRALLAMAAVVLFGELLLNCPARFSARHLADHSLLRYVVDALALWGRWPTARGVEVRSLIFYLGASALALVAAIRCIVAPPAARLSPDDLLDLRSRLARPYAWWIVLLGVAAVSSIFSHATRTCLGQLAIHLIEFAWWLPLAALLVPRDAVRLVRWLLVALALTAGVGIWYHAARVLPSLPGARLSYPLGNGLWFAACLLPGLFVGAALASAGREFRAASWHSVACVAACAVVAVALYWTGSRSAFSGAALGLAIVLVLAIGPRWRKHVTLGLVLAAAAVVAVVQHRIANDPAMLRTHSIRSRVRYEWPYAMRLFLERPVGGHGDGGYAILAGQMARVDQLDDPAILRFNEINWTGHAHNEFLERFADVGALGTIAFIAALLITLWRALQFVDAARGQPTQRPRRRLVIGLAAALVAMAVEEFGSPALREPGMPPVFFTVWACLSALAAGKPTPATDQLSADARPPIGAGMVRLGGVAAMIASLILGYLAVADWRAARARLEAEISLESRDYAKAAAQAEFSAARRLDPFQRNLARVLAIWAESLELDERLRTARGPVSTATIALGERALTQVDRLNLESPRFLRVSRLEAELSLNLSRAYERRGETLPATERHARFLTALARSREDEPFEIDRVQALWVAKAPASPVDRLNWLRCLLRGGQMPPGFLELFRTFGQIAGTQESLAAMMQVARQDQALAPDRWHSNLSPETFRLAALAEAFKGDLAKATALAQDAADLYAKAGVRLFEGRAAALHEIVTYRLDRDPVADTNLNLQTLASAQTVMDVPVGLDVPLIAPMGVTRLGVLLAAGREDEADVQFQKLEPDDTRSRGERLAGAYVNLAGSFSRHGRKLALAEKWCRRAQSLSPSYAVPSVILTHIYLQRGEDDRAGRSAAEYLTLAGADGEAVQNLQSLRRLFPNSPIWADLQRAEPRLALPASQPASQPASAPAP